MTTLTTSQNSTLSRAILRCEMQIDSTKLTNTQLVNFEDQTFSTKSRLSTFPTSTLESREYIIIPVVACIGDRVAHPLSEANLDELIPATVLGDVPSQWDGRPIVLDHPPLSEDANTPQSYQSRKFGLMFNTTYDFNTNKLTTDAWIDYERAKEVGADYLIDKIVSGDITEVSIGVLRQLLFQKGEHNGQPYQAIWVKMISDHLAFLHSDQIGACSVEVGCGAGRLENVNGGDLKEIDMATASNTKQKPPQEQLQPKVLEVSAGVNPEPNNAITPSAKSNNKFSLSEQWKRFKSLFELSSNDLRGQLYSLLYDKIPGFAGIVDVLPESQRCIFETYRNENGYELWMIGYSVDSVEKVSIPDNTTPVQVTGKLVWVSVESGVAVSEEKGEGTGTIDTMKANQCDWNCACDKNKDNKAAQEDTTIGSGTESEFETEAITTTGDLEMSDEKKSTETTGTTTTTTTNTPATPPSTPVNPPASPTPPTTPANQASSTPVDLEAFLRTAPPEIRRIVERDRQNELRTRNSAIESVLANQRQEVWTKERLEQLDTDTLVIVAESLQGEDDIQQLPTQQSYSQPNHADYSGSRSSFGTTNKSVDPRDNSRSLGWGSGEKKSAN